MQTNFSITQLADSAMAESEKILRTCVHCGFCLATCPTYQILGDELDSPRGRIYQIKEMFESGRDAPETVVTHVDRCLSCLSCMSTCPSGVHYMHLVDHARAHINETYDRPLHDKALRWVLKTVLPNPALFRLALIGAMIGRPLAPLLPAGVMFDRLKAMLSLAPQRLPPPSAVDRPQVLPPDGPRRKRVAILTGCAQPVLDPEINEATVRLLNRHGVEVVVAEGVGCCGALTHHMGEEAPALRSAKANIDAWWRETIDGGGPGLDAIVITTSGCGTTIKDYAFMLRDDPAYSDKAAAISALTRDLTEFLGDHGLMDPVIETGHRVTYHSACSMQHGQQIKTQPIDLLKAAGFKVRQPADAHLCCGSAGTYNLLQPDLATTLRNRKVGTLERTKPEIIAAGNIGCMTQIGTGTSVPIAHTASLLDWATGGPKPLALAGFRDPAPRPTDTAKAAPAIAAE